MEISAGRKLNNV